MTDTAARTYQRFDIVQRVQHIVLLVSFTVLAITGLPQKFATTGWGETSIAIMGGIETTRIIHRVSAVVMLLVIVAHVVETAYRLVVLRKRPHMVPTFKDVTDAVQALLYNLGLRKEHPKIGRFGYEEKAEYWALVWGTVIMALTGFFMWNPITTSRFFPGELIPAAKAAHGGEAILAVLAIILWHFYNVHLKHWNRSIFTGKLNREEMAEFHAQELEDIEAGRVESVPDGETTRRRQRVFIPVAAVLVIAWLVGVFLFATYEDTAIATVPRQEIEVFVPLTPTPVEIPPTAQPLEAAGGGDLTWAGAIQPLMEGSCGACHGSMGGLTLTEYDAALAGGSSGPGVVPGDPAGSQLVIKQQAGGHAGQLSDADLNMVIEWIELGAPE